MNHWYEILAELSCETEYGDTGIVDGKGKMYKGDNLDELIDEIILDRALIIDALQIYYDRPKKEAVSITWKIIDLIQARKHEKKKKI